MRLAKDVVQLISQYSPVVYCKLRCLNHEVKAMVDEVLPNIPDHSNNSSWKRRRTSAKESFIICCVHCCGMVLIQPDVFEDWIDSMMYETKMCLRECGESVELLCRNSLPKQGIIYPDALKLLCRYNRKEYLRELWNESIDKKSRFPSDCLASFKYADESLKKDKEIVMAAVKQDRREIHFADESLKKDKEVIMAAVKQDGMELRYARESLLPKDREVVMESICTEICS